MTTDYLNLLERNAIMMAIEQAVKFEISQIRKENGKEVQIGVSSFQWNDECCLSIRMSFVKPISISDNGGNYERHP